MPKSEKIGRHTREDVKKWKTKRKQKPLVVKHEAAYIERMQRRANEMEREITAKLLELSEVYSSIAMKTKSNTPIGRTARRWAVKCLVESGDRKGAQELAGRYCTEKETDSTLDGELRTLANLPI